MFMELLVKFNQLLDTGKNIPNLTKILFEFERVAFLSTKVKIKKGVMGAAY